MRLQVGGLCRHSRWLAVILVMSLFGLALGPGVATAAGSTAVSVSAPTQPVAPGAQFTVNVVVVPGTSIAGMQFDMTYSASLVSVSKITESSSSIRSAIREARDLETIYASTVN